VPVTAAQHPSWVKLCYDEQNLYLLYEVWDPTPWLNNADSFDSLFLHGDCVDLMLRTNPDAKGRKTAQGDLRLLFGPFDGKNIAVLYDAVVPGTQEPVVFASPGHRTSIDVVRVLDQAQVAVRKWSNGFRVEAAAPLEDLHLKLSPGMTLSADIGILRSNAAGADTVIRSYLFNRKTGIVDDVGLEARLQPAEWGELRIK